MSSIQVNPKLRAFWATDELDEAQALCDELSGSLDVTDVQGIKERLRFWEDRQAIANLLMFPMLIPDSVRVESLLRGLHEQNMTYYILAAAVGLGKVEKEGFDDPQATMIGESLLKIIEQRQDIIAERASAALRPYVNVEHRRRLLALLEHPSAIVRHNCLAALLRLLPYTQRHTFFESALRDRLLSMSAFLEITDKLIKVEQDTDDEADYRLNLLASGLTTPLLAYIPNLKDTWQYAHDIGFQTTHR